MQPARSIHTYERQAQQINPQGQEAQLILKEDMHRTWNIW